jgi:hypothetical protein
MDELVSGFSFSYHSDEEIGARILVLSVEESRTV